MNKAPSQKKQYIYQDATKLTNWVTLWLWICVVCAIALTIGQIFELKAVLAGHPLDFDADDPSNEVIIISLVNIIVAVVFITAAINFCRWVYRIVSNIRTFPTDNTLTPGLTVLWYFIPGVNLFVPYLDMRNMWRVSQNPSNWQKEPPPNLVRAWWLTWIGYAYLGGTVSTALQKRDLLVQAQWLDLAGDIFLAVSCILLILVINKINQLQKAKRWVTPQITNQGNVDESKLSF